MQDLLKWPFDILSSSDSELLLCQQGKVHYAKITITL